MDNKLVLKEIDFYGDKLIAAKDENIEKIYIAVKWVCQGLKLTRGQMQNERLRIKEDIVLSKGERKIMLPTSGGLQEVQCLELDYLPLWLAKINVNVLGQEKIRDKLIQYQLKAKDELAKAFLYKEYEIPKSEDEIKMIGYQKALERVKRLQLENDEMKPKAEFFDQVADSKDAIEIGDAAKVLNTGIGRNSLFKFLRDKRILMYNNIPYQEYIDRGYFRTIEQKYTKPDGSTNINIKTLVYQKGLDYIRKILKDENIAS